VQHLRGDIGVIGRDLAPSALAAVGGDLDEADKFIGEGFDIGDFHDVRTRLGKENHP
jgi:hypothetical protein